MRLPTYEELSKDEQDPIYNFKLSTNLLVTGPPGTGKTVLALYRAQQLTKRNKTFFLVFNRTLNSHLQTVLKKLDLNACSETWTSWFRGQFKKWTGENPPRQGENEFSYNWDEIFQKLMQHQEKVKECKYDHIVIDEGQDLPIGFFRLVPLLTEHLSIFMDENQMLLNENSCIDDVKKAIPNITHKEIKRNYRNTLEIAKLSGEYYTGMSSGKPDLPKNKKGPRPRLLVTNKEDMFDIVKNIINNNNNKSIGIFFWQIKDLKNFYQDYAKKIVENDTGNFHNRSFLYCSENIFPCPDCHVGFRKICTGKYGEYWGCTNYPEGSCKIINRGKGYAKYIYSDFTENMILFSTYASCKGLEFDIVLLPLWCNNQSTKWEEKNRMAFYVLTSRPREELTFLSINSELDIIKDGNINHNLLDVIKM